MFSISVRVQCRRLTGWNSTCWRPTRYNYNHFPPGPNAFCFNFNVIAAFLQWKNWSELWQVLGHTEKGKKVKENGPNLLEQGRINSETHSAMLFSSIFRYDILHHNKTQVTIFISKREPPLYQDNGDHRHCMVTFPTSMFYFLNNTDSTYITCPVFQTLPGWFPSALCRIHSVLCARWAVQTFEILIPDLQWMYWEAPQEIQLNEFNVEKLKYTCISKKYVILLFLYSVHLWSGIHFYQSSIHNRCHVIYIILQLFEYVYVVCQDSSKVLQKHYLNTDYFNCSHKMHFIKILCWDLS